MRDLFPAFRETKEDQSDLAPAVSQVTLIHNNQYVNIWGAHILLPFGETGLMI